MERSFRDKRNISKKENIILNILVFSIISIFSLFSLVWIFSDYAFASHDFGDNYMLAQLVYGENRTNTLSHPKVIRLVEGESITKHLTLVSSISELLKEKNIILNDNQFTSPDIDSFIYDNSSIHIYTMDKEFVKKYKDIKFETIIEYSDEVKEGEKVIEHAGSVGKLEIKYERVYIDEVLKSEIEVSRKEVKQPQARIEVIGKKKEGIQDCTLWDSVIEQYAPATKNKTKNIWMRYIMRKETWCNSGKNTRNTYFGLFQFVPNTFRGNGGVDIYDGEDQIRVVSRMYDICQQRQWSCSYRSCNGSKKNFQTEFPNEYKEIEKKCGRL